MKQLDLFTAAFLVLTAAPAYAGPFTYAPEHCEFTITFPSEPHIEKRCDIPEKQERCYDNVQFTQTFGMDAAIEFRVICNPIDEDIRAKYGDDVIAATLDAMTKDKVVKKFDASVQEGDGFKLAGIVGQGQKGMHDTIYLAQLWIGANSALSLEAEMSGAQTDEADRMFQGIMKSVSDKAGHDKQKQDAEKNKVEDSSGEKETEDKPSEPEKKGNAPP